MSKNYLVTKNEFFHKSRAYVIYLGIPLLLGLGMLMIIPALIETPMSDLETDVKANTDTSNTSSYSPIVIIIFSIMMYSALGRAKLFRWLFPKIELEDSVKPKVRKTILGVISAIVLSLLTGGIIIFIQNFSNQ